MLWNSLPTEIKASERKAILKENPPENVLIFKVFTVFTSVSIRLSCKEVVYLIQIKVNQSLNQNPPSPPPPKKKKTSRAIFSLKFKGQEDLGVYENHGI